jgi:hypothetical protein
MIGDKRYTEALDYTVQGQYFGRGAFCERRSLKVTDSGVHRSEDADISNVKTSEILVRRKPKVSWATIFVPGLVGS